MIREDTIAAVSTASGPGAISIVRLSGPDSLRVADRLFRCPPPRPSARTGGTFVYGKIVEAGDVVDEGLMLIFRAPNSYTREDVVELQCHGGRESVRRVLRLALEAGARPAEPGEFTKRAFLNGRIDLVQAEAVMDLISAQSDRAAVTAVEQMAGGLSGPVNRIYDGVVAAAADLEAGLDFPEEDFPEDVPAQALAIIESAVQEAEKLLATWEEGHRLREGALVVLTGLPNSGKSTLLNRLLKRDRAIVSPTPGTTRDTIEETMVINGMPLRIVDTAGLRTTDCLIEQEGIARTRTYMAKADLRIHLVDASIPCQQDDLLALADAKPGHTLVFMNKTDLGLRLDPAAFLPHPVCSGSLLAYDPPAPLLEQIAGLLNQSPSWTPHATLSERHRHLLVQSRQALQEAALLLESGKSDALVPAASHLREASDSLGQITGRTFHREMLEQVFSRFCIGK